MRYRSCHSCLYDIYGNVEKCKKNIKFPFELFNGQKYYSDFDFGERGCKSFYAKDAPKDTMKPWEDKESLFCDTEFLKQLLGKEPLKGTECKDEIE